MTSRTPPGNVPLAPTLFQDLQAGGLRGEGVEEIVRTLGDLRGIFADEGERARLPQDRIAYRVQSHLRFPEGHPGGLYFGFTFLEPGLIGREYAMTKGHFHALPDRVEYYWCVRGEGALLLMDRGRRTRAERMLPGSLHLIPPHTAHRVANTGREVLSFGACWPSDAGHDYASIARDGFSARLLEVDGMPALVAEG